MDICENSITTKSNNSKTLQDLQECLKNNKTKKKECSTAIFQYETLPQRSEDEANMTHDMVNATCKHSVVQQTYHLPQLIPPPLHDYVLSFERHACCSKILCFLYHVFGQGEKMPNWWYISKSRRIYRCWSVKTAWIMI